MAKRKSLATHMSLATHKTLGSAHVSFGSAKAIAILPRPRLLCWTHSNLTLPCPHMSYLTPVHPSTTHRNSAFYFPPLAQYPVEEN